MTQDPTISCYAILVSTVVRVQLSLASEGAMQGLPAPISFDTICGSVTCLPVSTVHLHDASHHSLAEAVNKGWLLLKPLALE